MEIPFILANLQISRAAIGVLEEILSKGMIKVALTQEPWCHKGRIRGLNLSGDQIISCTSSDRPRACVYVNGVDAKHLPQLSTMDAAAAVLSFQEHDKEDSYVLFLSTTLNRESQPTFRNSVREEVFVFALSLCSSNIVHKIKEWRVSGETSPHMSDQCHILFTLSEEARQAIAYRDPEAKNWDLYRSELTRDIEGILLDVDWRSPFSPPARSWVPEPIIKANMPLHGVEEKCLKVE
ncbi:hypothetical protein J437_LFUL009372 [Ladona fulva]|uniref:Uncharacterized protein n=1 Tax=Ladona fulva TaxID=123851 RepID=A0A8K0K5Y2_LADFU|nr:hypothetical protein J437_LFUL009372 [Ladona fulva]